jgi:hypothetical protein
MYTSFLLRFLVVPLPRSISTTDTVVLIYLQQSRSIILLSCYQVLMNVRIGKTMYVTSPK